MSVTASTLVVGALLLVVAFYIGRNTASRYPTSITGSGF